MARKNSKNVKHTNSLTVVEDTNFHAPKTNRKPKPQIEEVTMEQLLQESGETMEELVDANADATPSDKPTGVSNLANTIRAHRHNYRVATKSTGKKTQNNGDYVANVLLNMPLEVLATFVQARTGKNYDHLNPGHQRMCYGNHIRAWNKKDDSATIEWLAAHEPMVEAPAVEEEGGE